MGGEKRPASLEPLRDIRLIYTRGRIRALTYINAAPSGGLLHLHCCPVLPPSRSHRILVSMLLTSSSSLCASDQGLQISIAPLGSVLGRADHHEDADLHALIDAGRGDVPLVGMRFRCANCGSRLTDFVVTATEATGRPR